MNFRKISISFLLFFIGFFIISPSIIRAETLEEILNKITELQAQITQLQAQITQLLKEYKCPDINEDGKVDIFDITLISNILDTCEGDSEYLALADINGDGCITNYDLNYVNQYYGKKTEEIYPQCVSTPPEKIPEETPEEEYSCPDLNLDGSVDVYDTVIITLNFNSCQGDSNFNV